MNAPLNSSDGLALAVTTVTVTGSVLGIQYHEMTLGFAGGIVALSFLPKMSWGKVALTLLTSSLFAGFFSPLVTIAALHYYPWVSGLGEPLRIAVSSGLGMGAQVIGPGFLATLKRLFGGTK